LESGFYGSGSDTVLSLAARAPAVESLMLVGHQPTWSMLVLRLTGEHVDMKTASVAVIEITIDDWSQLEVGHGVLADLHQARPFYGSEWDDHK
jgi:phosphohistidine phosphatase SixA